MRNRLLAVTALLTNDRVTLHLFVDRDPLLPSIYLFGNYKDGNRPLLLCDSFNR